MTSLVLELVLTDEQQEHAHAVIVRLVQESMQGVRRDELPPAEKERSRRPGIASRVEGAARSSA